MNELKLIENGLIPVYESEKGKVANARELHKFLEVGKDFTNWIKDRIEKYDFIENTDFVIFAENGENPGRPKTEYILTLDTAKEIAMVQNNAKGKEIRKYFIKVEKKYKENNIELDQLSPGLKMFNQMFQVIAQNEIEQKKLNQAVTETKQEVQAIRDVITLNPQAAWRRECNRILNAIGRELGDYKAPKDQVYAALKTRAGCRPNVLILNLQKRAKVNGMAPSKIEKLNLLDVLENEPRLKEIYVTIVKEIAIKNKIGAKEGI